MIINPDAGSATPQAPPQQQESGFARAFDQASANLAAGHGTLGDQSTVMRGSAANLVATAGTGFHLDPEAATALIASCDESLKILSVIEADIANVQQAPKLGGTKGALSVSVFTHKVASDEQGIAHAVRNLQATVVQMRQAYQKAAANYQAIEQQIADSVTQLGHEVQQQNVPAPRHGRNQVV